LTELSDAELLAIEARVLWTTDARGRLLASRGRSGAPAPYLFIGTSRGARTIALGAAVPDAVCHDVRSLIDADPLPVDPALEPAGLAACERLLTDALGPAGRSAGRAWVIDAVPGFACDARIVTSEDGAAPAFAADVPAGFTWERDEWQQLMRGELGAWAMCTARDSPVSLCHCSRISPHGVEAGVWTHPGHRGHGYAAAATAAWASLVLPTAGHVFYSTNAGNRASERVTEKLGLRPIGWLWIVSRAISP
jgi:RimJ/RimL family protein N-acetyltransferase